MTRKQCDETYDVVVCGGGMAGVCAALAAARHGAKTALVQDRPVLGGNSSSEIRVHIMGACASATRPNARETGIIEELMLENWVHNHTRDHTIWDHVLYDAVSRQEGLHLHLNTQVHAAEMRSPSRIEAALASQLTTEREWRFSAELFIDCSGDGRLGFEAGAEYRYGREARSEFNETLAPEKADLWTMGDSILFWARDVGRTVKFTPPPWARNDIDWATLPGHRTIDDPEHGYWWIELSDKEDNIACAEDIRHELLRYVFSAWNYIKNSGRFKADTLALAWVGSVPGRRESRRFVGDHILTENDVRQAVLFEDRVAYCGWPIDVHAPGGIQSSEPSATFIHLEKMASIPFRSLYSRNIENLLFAGRNISATHVGMGTTRVMGTGAVMGQAVGTAAALAILRGCTPRELGQKHIGALQQALLRDDAFLVQMPNADPNDLARKAQAKASAETAEGTAAKVIDGYGRDEGGERHCWNAGTAPASVELDLGRETDVGCVEIKFDSNLSRSIAITPNKRIRATQIPGPPPELVKDYTIEAMVGGSWQALVRETNNYQRFRRHRFRAIKTRRIRLVATATNGHPSVRVFEIRVYA